YREVRMMDIDQVIRRWLAGERIRAVARSTGLDRNTVRRLIRLGQQVGLKPGDAWPDEGKLQSVRERLSRPGAAAEQGPIEQALGSGRRRVVHGFMMVMGYSRLSCVIPVFFQDLVTVIDCFEQAFEFFGGCPRRVVIDGMKACVDKADPCTPRFNRTFLEYANYRGFLPDAARPRHPKDKPIVENTVRFVRERFFKGETFIDLSDVERRALIWCRDTAGRRIHGTTRRVPIEVFETEEKPVLIPLQGGRFDPPHWTDCKIHPDRHVRVDGALYSVPSRWDVGMKVQVRADRALVRIYVRGELIKTHDR